MITVHVCSLEALYDRNAAIAAEPAAIIRSTDVNSIILYSSYHYC